MKTSEFAQAARCGPNEIGSQPRSRGALLFTAGPSIAPPAPMLPMRTPPIPETAELRSERGGLHEHCAKVRALDLRGIIKALNIMQPPVGRSRERHLGRLK